jgi:hypothetical protein
MTGKPAEKGPIVAFSMPNVLLPKAPRMLSYRLCGFQIGAGWQGPHSGGASLRDSRSMYPGKYETILRAPGFCAISATGWTFFFFLIVKERV